MKRRKKRRYHSGKRNSGMKFFGFIGIILGAVICGYLTARFVVAPLLGYETEVLKLDFPSKMTTATEEKQEADDKKDTESAPGAATEKYVLQFGIFSNRSGGEELVRTLKKKDIDAEVKESDGRYKVLSRTFDTKEEALKKLEALKDEQDIDVFITVTDT